VPHQYINNGLEIAKLAQCPLGVINKLPNGCFRPIAAISKDAKNQIMQTLIQLDLGVIGEEVQDINKLLRGKIS